MWPRVLSVEPRGVPVRGIVRGGAHAHGRQGDGQHWLGCDPARLSQGRRAGHPGLDDGRRGPARSGGGRSRPRGDLAVPGRRTQSARHLGPQAGRTRRRCAAPSGPTRTNVSGLRNLRALSAAPGPPRRPRRHRAAIAAPPERRRSTRLASNSFGPAACAGPARSGRTSVAPSSAGCSQRQGACRRGCCWVARSVTPAWPFRTGRRRLFSGPSIGRAQ